MNRARVPFVFHHQKTREAWAGWRMGNVFSFQFGCAFFINVTFMAGGMPGRKEEEAQWGFLIRR